MNKTENIKRQKAEADYWLTQLSHVVGATNIVCAGGAPRDWYFGHVARDIDIFVYEFVTDSCFRKACEKVGLYIPNPSSQGKEEYAACDKVCYVYDISPIQLILRRDRPPNLLLESFPLSLVKITYNMPNILHLHQDFKDTIESGIVKVSPNCTDVYLERIKAKYPAFNYQQQLPNFNEEF